MTHRNAGSASLGILMARGGSKRIPHKNTREFFGLPMMAWPLRAMLSAGIFEKVIVSTDDDTIAAIARSEGAEVPFVRPPELAGDFATTFDVVGHAVRHLKAGGENFQNICCAYGTSVFLGPERLREGLAALRESDADAVVAAVKFTHPVQRCFSIENGMAHFPNKEAMKSRTQDLTPYYHEAGSFYWYRSGIFASAEPGLHVSDFRVKPLVLPLREVVDIDDEEDLAEAEMRFGLMRSVGRRGDRVSENI